LKKRALIIGHSGQDGFYLTQTLESLNYEVFGVSNSASLNLESFVVSKGAITDFAFCENLFSAILPDEVYYLAALHQSSIEKSYDDLNFYKDTIDVNANGLLNFLECIVKYKLECKIFYASSSHIFGGTNTLIQNEETPYCPVSIYGVSKVLGMQYCELYRQKGVFCTVGVFYNHESPRRGSKFVSKKIIETAVKISKGEASELVLGDLSAKIDWGFAPDYVKAAHAVLQLDESGVFVISSGSLHTIEDFVGIAFEHLNLNWKDYVKVNSNIILKKSVTVLQGDNSKLKSLCNWEPTLSFKQMVEVLVANELMQ
jgi:GDPmannose 4,6-dehydratase